MRVLGLISGTSADGIDVAIAEITSELTPGITRREAGASWERQSPSGDNSFGLRLTQLAFQTHPWPQAERQLLFRLFAGHTTPGELCRANFALGERLAEAALATIADAGFTPTDIALIGSHGQTIWHDVDERGQVRSTLQLGEAAVIAERTGITTVADFRVADVAAGGQGAPLTSTFDWLLLRPPANLNGVAGGWRALQNIGGMGNVTFLPPLDRDAPPLAFDTGPGNALIDWAAGVATQEAQAYDVDGRLAAAGQVNSEALARWLSHPYFSQTPPKTTGRELFGLSLGESWREQAQLSDLDLAATLTELTAASIADAYARWAPGPVAQVVVSGGGARNPVLMARLQAQITARLGRVVEVCAHEALGIDGDAKEALVFALLAYLTIHGLSGNLPACTGARGARILGKITPGRRET